MDDTKAILAYWYDELGKTGWWTRSEATDATIRERFLTVWEEERSRTPESFLGSARDALGGVILFDQFPRNMFRGQADAFATDSLALAITNGAVAAGLDDALTEDERAFLYMPFMHSEHLDDQQRAVALFTALGQDEPLKFAKQHHDIIERFGRFPARNAALGRSHRAGEAEAAAETAGW